MTNTVYFGGLIGGLILLLLIGLAVWAMAGRTLGGSILGLGAAALVGTVAGPFYVLAVIALTFSAHEHEKREASRPPPPPVPYERPHDIGNRIGHNFYIEVTLKDEAGNRVSGGTDVVVMIVEDPAAPDGLGTGKRWTAKGPALNLKLGKHTITSKLDAKRLISACFRSSSTTFDSLYRKIEAFRGKCTEIGPGGFLLIDGKSRPIDWPEEISVANMTMVSTGVVID